MVIESIVAGVELAADEPAVKRRIAVIQDLVPGFDPYQILRGLCPEAIGIIYGSTQRCFVCIGHAWLLSIDRIESYRVWVVGCLPSVC
jgi:hypothetical protein